MLLTHCNNFQIFARLKFCVTSANPGTLLAPWNECRIGNYGNNNNNQSDADNDRKVNLVQCLERHKNLHVEVSANDYKNIKTDFFPGLELRIWCYIQNKL